MEKLTEEALSKPARIVIGYLDGLMVSCEHRERGCVELVELGLLETHISVCEYKPVTCPNERCEAVVNMADLEEHTTEVCEYRQVYCEECDENMSLKKYGKHGCFISKDVQTIKVVLFQVQDQVKTVQDQVKTVQDQVKEVQDQVKEMSNRQNEMFEAIQNLTTAVSNLSNTKPQGNIVVVGGQNGARNWLNSVEMYSLDNRTWSKLTPMQEKRAAPTAHFYNGRVMVTGGYCGVRCATSSIEYVRIREELQDRILPESVRAYLDDFFPLVRKLPCACYGHKTTILNDHLWLVGAYFSNSQQPCSNAICMTPINSTGTFHVKCRMPKPLSFHGLEIVNGNQLLIIGGSTTGRICDAIKTVLSYNTATNALRELHPLPFPMLDMATVKHGDDVIIIGGLNKDFEYLNTVFKYNYKKHVCEQLPGMKYKRAECAAVISGNKVFVMGGYNDEQGYLSSVECFDLERQVWHELPSMSEAKFKIAAVLVPSL
jgi:N-acetylneuraminic acid mutarotase